MSRTTVSDYSERYSRRTSVSIGDHTNSMSVYYILCVYAYVCAGVRVCVYTCTMCSIYKQPRLVNSDTYSATNVMTVDYDYDPACRIHGNYRYLWRVKKVNYNAYWYWCIYPMPTSHPQDFQENKQITPFDSRSAWRPVCHIC